MSELRKCPNCGNLQSRIGDYCAKCGTNLSNVKETPYIVTAHERQSYRALRFASSLMVFMGWLIILVSIVASLYLFSQYTISGDALRYQGQSDVPLYDPNTVTSPNIYLAGSLVIGLVGSAFGIFQIAAGQVFMVLLDIRDDVRSSRIMPA